MAMIWLYYDTRSVEAVSKLSSDVFWLVIPSLVLFATLPWLLKKFSFAPAMGFAALMTVAAYFVMFQVLKRFGIQL